VPIAIPPALTRNVAETWGEPGMRWLSRLPALLDGVAADWDLTLGAPYRLSFHWVARVTRSDGSAAVLKVGFPDGHLAHEAQALAAFDGQGAVRLLAHDRDRGALLLERADPGTPAADLVPARDAEATAVLVAVGRRLHRTPPPGCTLPDLYAEEARSFRDHLGRFPGDGPLPRHLVQRAATLFDELCASAAERVVLHGDLHHDNVLRGHREPWLAIDPHGVVGDPGYDCGAMLYNPLPRRPGADLGRLVPARIEQLADGFALPLDRVVAWGFVMGVLSEVWTAQGGGAVQTEPLAVARHLYPRLP
jgi:streptomycin 6-kinase